jgi:hypothetical protein
MLNETNIILKQWYNSMYHVPVNIFIFHSVNIVMQPVQACGKMTNILPGEWDELKLYVYVFSFNSAANHSALL